MRLQCSKVWTAILQMAHTKSTRHLIIRDWLVALMAHREKRLTVGLWHLDVGSDRARSRLVEQEGSSSVRCRSSSDCVVSIIMPRITVKLRLPISLHSVAGRSLLQWWQHLEVQ